MAKTSKIRQVESALAKAMETTQVLRAQLAASETNEKRLAITLEVLQSLGEDEEDDDAVTSVVATNAVDLGARQSVPSHAPATSKGRGIRGLIIGSFVPGTPQTAQDVVKRLSADGQEVNSSTISSTLSKLVTDGILVKASQSAYLLKVESPNT